MFDMLLWFAVVMVLFAVGDVVAKLTKARISSVFATLMLFLILFVAGVLPADIIEKAGLSAASSWSVPMLLFAMGSMINLRQFMDEWRTVVTCWFGMLAVIIGVSLTIPIIGKEMALSVAPIFAGGSAATLIMTTALDEMGLVTASTLCIVMYVVQKFIGVPIASLLLRRTAVQFRDNPALVAEYSQQQETVAGSRRGLLQLPASFARPSVYLAKLGLVAVAAHFLSELTGGVIHYFVLCLVMGAVFFALGFLEKGIMSKTQSGGLITFFVTILIFSNLATTTPQQVLSVLPALLLSAACGVAGTVLLGFICAKVMNFPFGLAVSFGISCTFGFPTTMLIPQEVAEAFGRTETEKAAILNYLLPKMLTAGFVTVTIASVLIAGVVVRML